MEHLGPLVVKLALLCLVLWMILRFLVFLRILLRPAVKAAQPAIDIASSTLKKADAHVEDSLRRAGLGVIADAGAWADQAATKSLNGITKAMDAVETNSAPKK